MKHGRWGRNVIVSRLPPWLNQMVVECSLSTVDTLLPKGEDFPDVKGTPDGDSGRRSISRILKSIYEE